MLWARLSPLLSFAFNIILLATYRRSKWSDLAVFLETFCVHFQFSVLCPFLPSLHNYRTEMWRRGQTLGAPGAIVSILLLLLLLSSRSILFIPFCFNAPCQSIPVINLRPLIFDLTSFGWLRTVKLNYSIFSHRIITFELRPFLRAQPGRKTRAWCNPALYGGCTRKTSSKLTSVGKWDFWTVQSICLLEVHSRSIYDATNNLVIAKSWVVYLLTEETYFSQNFVGLSGFSCTPKM